MSYLDCIIDVLPYSILITILLIVGARIWDDYITWNGGVCRMNGKPWIRVDYDGYIGKTRHYVHDYHGDTLYHADIITPFVDRNYQAHRKLPHEHLNRK